MTTKVSEDPIKEEPILFDPPTKPEDLILEADVEFGTLDDLKASKPGLSVLVIPELKKKFYIRTLNGNEVDRYRSSLTTGKGNNITMVQRGMRAKLVVLALGNPDGSRMLDDKQTTEVQSWPSIVLERIFDRARKWNGLVETDTDDAGNS